MEKFISIANKRNKKGQIWSLDLIIAGVIFLIGIILLFFYAINSNSQSKNQLEEFFYEGNLASDLILSDDDGILSDGKINKTKLDAFDTLSSQDKKNSLGLTNNFYFKIDNLDMGGGRNYVGITNTSNVDNLIQITRLTIYENKPIKFEMFIWK